MCSFPAFYRPKPHSKHAQRGLQTRSGSSRNSRAQAAYGGLVPLLVNPNPPAWPFAAAQRGAGLGEQQWEGFPEPASRRPRPGYTSPAAAVVSGRRRRPGQPARRLLGCNPGSPSAPASRRFLAVACATMAPARGPAEPGCGSPTRARSPPAQHQLVFRRAPPARCWLRPRGRPRSPPAPGMCGANEDPEPGLGGGRPHPTPRGPPRLWGSRHPRGPECPGIGWERPRGLTAFPVGKPLLCHSFIHSFIHHLLSAHDLPGSDCYRI